MKTRLYLPLAALAVLLTACSSQTGTTSDTTTDGSDAMMYSSTSSVDQNAPYMDESSDSDTDSGVEIDISSSASSSESSLAM